MTIQIKDMPTTEVDINDQDQMLEIAESSVDMDETTQGLEALLVRMETLNNLGLALEAFDQHTPTTSALTQITTDMVRQGTDLDEEEVVPGLESYSNTSVSLEGVLDTLKKTGMKILEFITSLWTRFIAWTNQFFDQTERLKKKAVKLRDELKGAESKPKSETITVAPAVARYLTVGKDKPSKDSVKRSMSRLTEVMAYSNALVRGTLAGWDKSKSAFDRIISTNQYVDMIVDALGDQSKVYKSVEDIVQNFAPVYMTVLSQQKDHPHGQELPGGLMLKWSVKDMMADQHTAAGYERGGESWAKINLLRLYSEITVSVIQDLNANKFESTFTMPALSRTETIDILDSVITTLTQLSDFRNKYRKQLDKVSKEAGKMVAGFGKLMLVIQRMGKADNALRNPGQKRGQTSLIYVLSFGMLSSYSRLLTRTPSKLMGVVLQSSHASLTYANKCAKQLGVGVAESEPTPAAQLALPQSV